MIRAKAEVYYNFEKPARYFCNLDKHNYTNKVIHCLKHKDRVIRNQQEILYRTKTSTQTCFKVNEQLTPLRKTTLFINASNIEHL